MQTHDHLRRWMAENNIRQSDLARALCVSEALVSRVIAGDRPTSGHFRWRFAQAYGYLAAVAVLGDCALTQRAQTSEQTETATTRSPELDT